MPSPYTNLRALCREMCRNMDRERLAYEAGEAACAASLDDATLRCLRCGYSWDPELDDWFKVGGTVSRVYGDTEPDVAIDCPACHRQLSESDVEDI